MQESKPFTGSEIVGTCPQFVNTASSNINFDPSPQDRQPTFNVKLFIKRSYLSSEQKNDAFRPGSQATYSLLAI
jgi:hypothetical protein